MDWLGLAMAAVIAAFGVASIVFRHAARVSPRVALVNGIVFLVLAAIRAGFALS